MSLSPCLASGDKVRMVVPACMPGPWTGRLALVRTGDPDTPLIKVARAGPGDAFAVGGSGTLRINGAVMRNSAGSAFVFSGIQRRLLETYAADFGGTVPADKYLLFGDRPHGSHDSGDIGFVHARDILAVGRRACLPRE